MELLLTLLATSAQSSNEDHTDRGTPVSYRRHFSTKVQACSWSEGRHERLPTAQVVLHPTEEPKLQLPPKETVEPTEMRTKLEAGDTLVEDALKEIHDQVNLVSIGGFVRQHQHEVTLTSIRGSSVRPSKSTSAWGGRQTSRSTGSPTPSRSTSIAR